MISLSQIVENIIEPALANTGYTYAGFLDAGHFQKAIRSQNTVKRYINTLYEMSDYIGQRISNGLIAAAQVITITFLLPLDDESDSTGNYPSLTAFRDALLDSFSQSNKFSLTVGEGATSTTYSGGVTFSLPTRAVREIRTNVGDSVEYRATVQVSYLENAVNATDVVFTLDDEVIPYTRFAIKRTASSSAVLTPDQTNGEGTVYNEVTALTIDIDMPILSGSVPSASVIAYILGTTPMNNTMTLTIAMADVTYTESVVFGECQVSGEGVSNLSAMVRLVPSVLPNMEA